jgi:hypothetical protein
MDQDKLGGFLAKCYFRAIHAINRWVAGRGAAQGQDPALGNKTKMHEVTLDLLGEVQRSQGGAGSNGEFAQHSRCKRARHGSRVVLAILGETNATDEVAYQLYDPLPLEDNASLDRGGL